jgi:hypothetical protein
MALRSITETINGETILPETREEWDSWISATQTRAYILRNPLTDWLNRYGVAHGWIRDTDQENYDERLDFVPFIMRKGIEFEAAIGSHIDSLAETITIAEGREDIRDLAAAHRTFEALVDGHPVIRQAVLRDAETQTYGSADFLVRSDVFSSLFPGHISVQEAATPAADLGNRSWHYIVIDAKFTTLHLLAGGDVGNTGSAPAYKAQLYVYNRALGRLQGYTPPKAFLLGRGWEQTVRGVKSRGFNAMERLGPITMDDSVRVQVDAACEWVSRMRSEGSAWSVLPQPSVPELWPNASDDGWPWHTATSQVAHELSELTQLWNVGPDKRDAAHRKGVFTWRDPQANAQNLGVTGEVTGPALQAFLDVNQTDEGPAVRPARIHAAEADWRPEPPLEFYVDFETVNSVNDDFSQIPAQNGQHLIFMVGCGHMQDGEWVFRSFTTDRLTEAAEGDTIDAWLAHMGAVSLAMGVDNARIIHWSFAEPVNYELEFDSARERHPEKGWPRLHWFDLWAKVFRAEPVVVRGALGFGLKSVARAFHRLQLIETSWGDSQVDGLGAMTGAWWCDDQAAIAETRLADSQLMQDIAAYNEVDTKVMMEILRYLRDHH